MNKKSRIPSSLAELQLFADIPSSQLRRASSLLTPVSVGAGEVLLTQGKVAREFLIVAGGLVSVSRADDDGAEELTVVNPGEVLGEMSLLHGGPRSATVTALVPTSLFVATPQEFFALLKAVPSAAEQIVRTANERLRANMAA